VNENAFTFKPGAHLHLVGIGGSGMSAIARVLLGLGCVVSGSDVQQNEATAVLQEAGVTVYQGHRAKQIAGADALVISSAIPTGNPEVDAALAAGLPVLKRADLLGQLMADSIGIAVAGTHGKTTTTGMIAHLLVQTGHDPSVILGGVLPEWGSNGRYGAGDYFLVEADEYDYMFLGLRPEIAIITNVEHDHPDIFPTPEAYQAAFRQFIGLLPSHGRLIVCGEDPGARALLDGLELPGVEITTYGLVTDGGAAAYALQASDWRANQLGGTDFVVQEGSEVIGLARLRVPGLHNVRNALAAIAVGLDLAIDFTQITQALAGFGGIQRRFQITGEVGGVTIIDDYAHHPTEIRVTLAAARQRYPGRRLWAVWQPHTYSRTRLLLDEFAASFADADRVIVLDIYRSRETETLGMDTAVVIQAMQHSNAVHIPDRAAAAAYLVDRVRPDDVILTLGAGDGNVVGQWVLEKLRARVR
jgi:UDP-N-acetylmuramate--alanine ligase